MAREGGSLSARTAFKEFALAFVIVASAAVPSARALGFAPDKTHYVSLAELPPEARQTEQLIRSGGPFPHTKDSTVFGNREHRLPRQARGYYREYTVVTPGSRNRGARRIVCGGTQAREPDACYYSADHYASFRRIVP